MPSRYLPISFRPGELRPILDARCDRTDAGYRALVKRELARYYLLLHDLASWVGDEEEWYAYCCRHLEEDQYERAAILMEHDGYTEEQAMREVGLA